MLVLERTCARGRRATHHQRERSTWEAEQGSTALEAWLTPTERLRLRLLRRVAETLWEAEAADERFRVFCQEENRNYRPTDARSHSPRVRSIEYLGQHEERTVVQEARWRDGKAKSSVAQRAGTSTRGAGTSTPSAMLAAVNRVFYASASVASRTAGPRTSSLLQRSSFQRRLRNVPVRTYIIPIELALLSARFLPPWA